MNAYLLTFSYFSFFFLLTDEILLTMRRGATTTTSISSSSSAGQAGQVQCNVSGEKRAATYTTAASLAGNHDPFLSRAADDKVRQSGDFFFLWMCFVLSFSL